jgi:hypothetical protein
MIKKNYKGGGFVSGYRFSDTEMFFKADAPLRGWAPTAVFAGF